MRKNAFYLFLLIALLALSLPATQPTRSSQVMDTPVLPFSPYGIVISDGYNLGACNDIAGCPDVQASCGTFVFSHGQITLEGGKSWYAMNIPFDDPETQVKEGCTDGETITFTIIGEPADQPGIPWIKETSMEYDISFGTTKRTFLPMVRK